MAVFILLVAQSVNFNQNSCMAVLTLFIFSTKQPMTRWVIISEILPYQIPPNLQLIPARFPQDWIEPDT